MSLPLALALCAVAHPGRGLPAACAALRLISGEHQARIEAQAPADEVAYLGKLVEVLSDRILAHRTPPVGDAQDACLRPRASQRKSCAALERAGRLTKVLGDRSPRPLEYFDNIASELLAAEQVLAAK